MSVIVVALGRGRQLRLARVGRRIQLTCPAGAPLRLTRRQAWALAEALDALATAADDGA